MLQIVTRNLLTAFFIFSAIPGTGQSTQKQTFHRCATMEVMHHAFQKDPALRDQFNKAAQDFQQLMNEMKSQPSHRVENGIIYIPVVFHIVLTDPAVVTDAQVNAQLDTLNKDFAGRNGDSVKIPAAFKSLFGKSRIQFRLAQRTPQNGSTNGIVRLVTTRQSFSATDNSLKHTANGGADAWDPTRYLNIWVCNLSGGVLGYATFPGGSAANEQGVVVLYSSLPGGTAAPYNKGRTLTHETGHFFNLYHIWGDDDGACSGTDQVDDTPNQANSTAGCPSGTVKTDACTNTAPGILYQDYMDYTDDPCMVMFTHQQVLRMHTAVETYRGLLMASDADLPLNLKNLDAALITIDEPDQRICQSSIVPKVTLRNNGRQVLTSATIQARIDHGTPSTTSWTGSLATLASVSVPLNNLSVPSGKHTLQFFVTTPNGGDDENKTNDTLSTTVEYYPPVTPPFTESFENSVFPPPGWDLVNPDHAYTWERVTGIARTGNAAVVLRNFDYQQNDAKDHLRLPQVTIASADSAYLTFQVAAAVQTSPGTLHNVWDTLEVLISTDCGKTYTSLYKKWGSSLITRATPVLNAYVPNANEWRKDSVNLTAYINGGPFVLSFLNTTEFENNIYLDDIDIYKKIFNPVLKEKGLLITPNPTNGLVTVQFYPNPTGLRRISIYNIAGQKIVEKLIGNEAVAGQYNFDLGRYANGIYIVQVVMNNTTISRKIFKNR